MSTKSGTPSGPIHDAAAAGYAVGAQTYVKGRPEYPAEVLAWLKDDIDVNAGCTVVDLGAGTGKFTRLLVSTGASVIAVEPVAEMLAELATSVPAAGRLPGTATSIPLADASVDVVVCAQAFHWFATREALDEIVRVLKPGGRLALVWNLRDARIPWVARMDAIVNAYEGDVPRFYKGTWRQVFPHPGLTELQERQFDNVHAGSPEDVIVKRVLSTSFISALPQVQRGEVEAELRVLIAQTPELRDAGVVSVPYRTFAFSTSKRS